MLHMSFAASYYTTLCSNAACCAWPSGSAAALAAALAACVEVSAGISRQFLYRSLYAPQLDRCAQVRILADRSNDMQE